jgi:FtsH-binding integral membrane protein
VAQVAALALLSIAHATRSSSKPRASVSPLRLALLLAFGASAGVNVGSWVTSALLTADACPTVTQPGGLLRRATTAIDVEACSRVALVLSLQAFALTGGLYAAFAAAALLAPPSGSGARLAASVLGVGVWLLLGAQICTRMGWASGLAADLYVRLGVVVYAGRIYFDTHTLSERVRADGDCDVVGHAVNIVANTLHLFIRVITLLAEHMAKQKR